MDTEIDTRKMDQKVKKMKKDKKKLVDNGGARNYA
jgi:hypothetical protein